MRNAAGSSWYQQASSVATMLATIAKRKCAPTYQIQKPVSVKRPVGRDCLLYRSRSELQTTCKSKYLRYNLLVLGITYPTFTSSYLPLKLSSAMYCQQINMQTYTDVQIRTHTLMHTDTDKILLCTANSGKNMAVSSPLNCDFSSCVHHSVCVYRLRDGPRVSRESGQFRPLQPLQLHADDTQVWLVRRTPLLRRPRPPDRHPLGVEHRQHVSDRPHQDLHGKRHHLHRLDIRLVFYAGFSNLFSKRQFYDCIKIKSRMIKFGK